MQVEFAMDSTRGPARAYAADMRSSTILIPLLFILADGVRCKDDAPAGGDFGEPCGEIETPCADGLKCFIGYCEEKCTENSDCQPVDGYRHECESGLCHILCDEVTNMCPQTLETPLECIVLYCESAL